MPILAWQRTLLFLLFIALPQTSLAEEVTVFDVRKTLPLSDSEPTYQDFYLNGGSEVGLKPGVVVTIKRRSTLYDAYQNRSPGDLQVTVGQLQVIHAQKGLSVARLHSLASREELPVLDYDYIMVGDRVDLSTATMEGSKKWRKSAGVSAPQPKAVEVSVASAAPTSTPTSTPTPTPEATPPAPTLAASASPMAIQAEATVPAAPATSPTLPKELPAAPVSGPTLQ